MTNIFFMDWIKFRFNAVSIHGLQWALSWLVFGLFFLGSKFDKKSKLLILNIYDSYAIIDLKRVYTLILTNTVNIDINAWSHLFINLKIILIFCLYPEKRVYNSTNQRGVLRDPNSQSKAENFWNFGAQSAELLVVRTKRENIG